MRFRIPKPEKCLDNTSLKSLVVMFLAKLIAGLGILF